MSTPAIALDPSFIPSNTVGLPIAQQTIQIVEVIAPTTLEAGYTFEAVYNNEVITVTVPAGGVKEGQRIQVPYQPTIPMVYAEPIAIAFVNQSTYPEMITATTTPTNNIYTNNSLSTTTPLLTPPQTPPQGETSNNDAPIGYWKDGLFDCCKYGCCHISVFCSLFFPRIMIAQILTRMKMTITGKVANNSNGREYKNTYQQMWMIVISFCLFKWFFGCPSKFYFSFNMNNKDDGSIPSYHPNNDMKDTDDQLYFDFDPHCARGLSIVNTIVTIMMGLYTFYILVKLRQTVRRKYRIPTGQTCSTATCCCCCCCHGCHPIEDYCLSFWFPCCTIAQLARQTANYNTNQAVCCSSDGLQQQQGQEHGV